MKFFRVRFSLIERINPMVIDKVKSTIVHSTRAENFHGAKEYEADTDSVSSPSGSPAVQGTLGQDRIRWIGCS